jgi:hypothetical protein
LGNGVKKKMSDENVRKNEIISVNELDEHTRRLVDNELADGIEEPISFL